MYELFIYSLIQHMLQLHYTITDIVLMLNWNAEKKSKKLAN